MRNCEVFITISFYLLIGRTYVVNILKQSHNKDNLFFTSIVQSGNYRHSREDLRPQRSGGIQLHACTLSRSLCN